MSLHAQPTGSIPDETARIARAAFPKGNPYLTLRDEFGTLFRDEDFADLFPERGQPAYSPWRLALVTILQFRENLSDRQAAEAVRARIDLKYLLGLELSDSGFDASVLSEFRGRLLEHSTEERLLVRVLEVCRERGLLKERGRQRTDATYVLAAVRQMNRLELVAETMRAALNALAAAAPDWLRRVAPPEWYERYGRRIEDMRLPQGAEKRKAYAEMVGADGFRLLGYLELPPAPEGLSQLAAVEALRQMWRWHYEQSEPAEQAENPEDERDPPDSTWPDSARRVRFRDSHELGPSGEQPESPYEMEARYCRRQGTAWIGYRAHLSESCDEQKPRLITNVDTTVASVHEIRRLEAIHASLAHKQLLPEKHLVDSAYLGADAVASSRLRYGVRLLGPIMPNSSWQTRAEGAFGADQFEIDWTRKQVRCPEGKTSVVWCEHEERSRAQRFVRVRFSAGDCKGCPSRARCTDAKRWGRQLTLHPQEQYEALQAARASYEEDRSTYRLRQGIEGTISQGVRRCGLRQARYRGLAKTHLQHVATAAALNVDRVVAWLEERPLARTRISRFAALAA